MLSLEVLYVVIGNYQYLYLVPRQSLQDKNLEPYDLTIRPVLSTVVVVPYCSIKDKKSLFIHSLTPLHSNPLHSRTELSIYRKASIN